uniref:Uncharacterized protein n=1 Tax=Rhizophora mucronata TaxID=61149 RepID=A0A2P2R2W3_RHIMU
MIGELLGCDNVDKQRKRRIWCTVNI